MTDMQVAGKRRSRFGMVVLGVLTFWPPLYMVLFMGIMFGSILLIPSGTSQGEPWFLAVIFPLHLFTMLEMMALTVYYAVSVYQDPELQSDRKLLWMIIVLLGGFIGQAIFYVLWKVRRHPGVSGSPTIAQPVVQHQQFDAPAPGAGTSAPAFEPTVPGEAANAPHSGLGIISLLCSLVAGAALTLAIVYAFVTVFLADESFTPSDSLQAGLLITATVLVFFGLGIGIGGLYHAGRRKLFSILGVLLSALTAVAVVISLVLTMAVWVSL